MISRMFARLADLLLDALVAPMIVGGAVAIRALQAQESAIEALWREQYGE